MNEKREQKRKREKMREREKEKERKREREKKRKRGGERVGRECWGEGGSVGEREGERGREERIGEI